MYRRKPRLRKGTAFAASVLALVCALPGFADHPKDMARILPACLRGSFASAQGAFQKDSRSSGRNQLLYLYELGGLYTLKGDFTQSAACFDLADQVAHEYEGKAMASVSGGLAQAGAGMTNDTLLTWEGACYDKVMSRTLNALNYIAKKDLEGARVEVRKAEEYQSQERERTRKLEDTRAMNNSNASSRYAQMFAFVQNVRNSYENAFTYFLASHIHRAQGGDGLNDALVDIKQAYALAPDSPAVQAAYLDLLAQFPETEGSQILENLKARLGAGPDWTPPDPARTGTLVVCYEAGFAPALSEAAVDLFAPSGDRFSMAFPIYNDFGSAQGHLRIETGVIRRTTTRLVDTRLLAVKSLKERLPGILARGTLGAFGKIQAQKKAEQEFGFLGKLITGIVTKAVTNADLRSWLSLPAEVQAAQLVLPPGTHELLLTASDWNEKVAVEVTPGTTTFITVRAVPGCHAITATTLPSGDGVPGPPPSLSRSSP